MKNIAFTKKMLWMLLIAFLALSCEDKMSEHYEVPKWLKGSAWEVLKNKGDYSIFLDGVEKAGYKPIMEGKSILTIMAPNDSAFTTYLKRHGYSNISEIKKSDLQKLIGFHLLYYSYNKEKLENFRPEGDQVSDEDKGINAGLYYKFRTRSSNTPTTEVNPEIGKKVTVYHLERFLPIFSQNFFNTKGINAKFNYEYFYPNSTWSGKDGFNVSNASVEEYNLTADNGYIYTLDKVLEPLETIYTELEKRDDYSIFFNLYDSYSTYEYDNTLSEDYGSSIGADSLYLHKHGTSLPPIAMEWPVSSYQDIKSLASLSYSVFAPSNKALNAFFTNFWEKGGYESLNDVDPLVMKHLLNQFVYGGSIVFPEEITNGKIKNSYGVKIEFDPSTVTDKAICVNGSFYGISSMKVPPLFASVIGPAFRNKDYINYLYMLDGSSLLNSLVSSDASFTMLIPSDKQVETSGIYLKSYNTGKVLQTQTEDGWSDVNSSVMQDIVNMHTMNGEVGLKSSGTQVCPTQSAFNYWYIKDGAITSNALFNQCIEPDYIGSPFVPFKEITNNGTSWNNGKAYSYDNTDGIFEIESSDGLKHALIACNDNRYPYYGFVQLMKKAGMISGTTIQGISGRFIAFIPTNNAIRKALNNNAIPGIDNGNLSEDGTLTGTFDISILSKYLQSYFITSDQNIITSYPYPGSSVKSGDYLASNGERLTYQDSETSLSIKLKGHTNVCYVIPQYYFFPFAYHDGCFHLIDTAL